jgi:hypothetical protein
MITGKQEIPTACLPACLPDVTLPFGSFLQMDVVMRTESRSRKTRGLDVQHSNETPKESIHQT